MDLGPGCWWSAPSDRVDHARLSGHDFDGCDLRNARDIHLLDDVSHRYHRYHRYHIYHKYHIYHIFYIYICIYIYIYIYTWEARYIISSDWWQKSRGVPGVVLQDRELRYREKIARDRAQSLESYSGSAQRGEMLWQWWNSKKNQEDFITCSSLFYVYIHTCTDL